MNKKQAKERIEELRKQTEYYAKKYYDDDAPEISDFEYDIRMCYWGDSTAGKILKEGENYSGEYKIKIHNEDLKDKIIDVLTNTDWKKELNSTAMCRIKQYHIIEILKRNIPEIN